MPTIVWVDSDPDIEKSTGFLKEKGYKVVCFNETQDCVNYFQKEQDVICIITSMMERGGRKERGLMNAFEMVIEIKKIWKRSYSPFLVMITTSADEQACKDNGFDVIVYYDRQKMKKIVVEYLDYNKNNILNKKPYRDPSTLNCVDLRTNAEKFFNFLDIPYYELDKFVDRCFCSRCEPKRIWYRGNPSEKYVLPTNWYRFGIKVRDEYLTKQAKIHDWNVGYHGTRVQNVKSIISHHRIMFPGDRLNDGLSCLLYIIIAFRIILKGLLFMFLLLLNMQVRTFMLNLITFKERKLKLFSNVE